MMIEFFIYLEGIDCTELLSYCIKLAMLFVQKEDMNQNCVHHMAPRQRQAKLTKVIVCRPMGKHAQQFDIDKPLTFCNPLQPIIKLSLTDLT